MEERLSEEARARATIDARQTRLETEFQEVRSLLADGARSRDVEPGDDARDMGLADGGNG